MLKNWFKKKQNNGEVSNGNETLKAGDKILAIGDSDPFYKVIREVTDKMSIQLESSTIPLWVGDLFMHHWGNPLVDDYDDPEWQNQGFYFWFADENFEKKSLPPSFEKMDKRFFRIIDNVKIFQGTAAPWFGMPGGGTKMGFGNSQNPTPIKIVKEQGCIEYIEITELSDGNMHILNDRENYILVANQSISFENNTFYLAEKPITLTQAYQIGVVSIAKIVR